MRKIWITLSLALLSCACNKADSGVEKVAQDYGYLTLNLSSDNDVNLTKASQTVLNTDLGNWTVTVSQDGGSFEPVTCKASELGTKAFAAGTYTVKVYNYADDDAACAANSNWGAARYEGSNTVSVEKGKSKTVTVDCGTAKNARFKVQFTESFTAICTNENGTLNDGYTFTASDRNLIFAKGTTSLAYYAAEATVGYTLSYTYKGSTKSSTGSFTMGAAATEKTITISANSNGTITLSISYDDTFTTVDGETVTIDAATGEVVVSQ